MRDLSRSSELADSPSIPVISLGLVILVLLGDHGCDGRTTATLEVLQIASSGAVGFGESAALDIWNNVTAAIKRTIAVENSQRGDFWEY